MSLNAEFLYIMKQNGKKSSLVQSTAVPGQTSFDQIILDRKGLILQSARSSYVHESLKLFRAF